MSRCMSLQSDMKKIMFGEGLCKHAKAVGDAFPNRHEHRSSFMGEQQEFCHINGGHVGDD